MHESESIRRQSPASERALSKREIESVLTDISAETYLLEAERLRARRQGAEAGALLKRERLVDERLERLEQTAAALRAKLERLARSES